MMFQQSIVVNKPHMKPVVLKSAADSEEALVSDGDSVMPLEYFSSYELELQETILQLNSQLEDDSDSSSDEEDSEGCGAADQETLSLARTDSCSCSESSVYEETEEPLEASHGQVQFQKCSPQLCAAAEEEVVVPNGQFDEFESSLQKAVRELTSLLVG